MEIGFSFDDGHELDFKVAAILNTYGIRGTFYIPVLNSLNADEVLELSKKHEVGCHTMTHPSDMKNLSSEQAIWEIGQSKSRLEEIIGKKVTKFCYPRGRYDERIKELVREAGFEEARTTQVLAIHKGNDPMAVPTTIHLYDRSEYAGQPIVQLAQELFNKAKEIDGYFHVWGHSWEIEKYGLWDDLEEICAMVAKELHDN